MDSVVYHRVEVENNKDSYSAFDELQFFLQAEGRALLRNSVRVEGILTVTKNSPAAPLSKTDNIFIDHNIGIHSVVDNLNVEIQNAGLIENYSDYPKYAKTVKVASTDNNDTHSLKDDIELISPTKNIARKTLVGNKPTNTQATSADRQDPSFSFKPICCLNNMSDNLSFQKTGYVKLSLTLGRVGSVLYGRNVDSNTNYTLSDVRLTFQSVPDRNPGAQVQMRTVLSLKNTIQSQLSNTMSKVPAVCDGVSCVFLKSSRENNLISCNTNLDRLSGIDEVQFLFSDSTSQYVSYVIDDYGEMIDRFVDSVNDTGHNMLNVNKNVMNFGIGLRFPPVDLSNQKFNIQIRSDNNSLSSDPHVIYMYFKSFVSL